MTFYPGINRPGEDTGGIYPPPYSARSTGPYAGLSNPAPVPVSGARILLAKKSSKFRELVFGILNGLLERLHLSSTYYGFSEGGTTDVKCLENLIDGNDAFSEYDIFGGMREDSKLVLLVGGDIASYERRADRSPDPDAPTLRGLKNPSISASSLMMQAFRLLGYDCERTGLIPGFPSVSTLVGGVASDAPILPVDVPITKYGWDKFGLLSCFVSDVCIPSPGYVQDPDEYMANPQPPPFSFKKFDISDVKWVWKMNSDGTYPVSSLVEFVKKLPMSFGDIDFICAGASGRRTDKLSYAASEILLPCLSAGFMATISDVDGTCPLQFRVYGDAGVLISKDPTPLNPDFAQKTIERLRGNTSGDTFDAGFMDPAFKMTPWLFHLCDAAILGPMQHRISSTEDHVIVSHKEARLIHSVTLATRVSDVDLSDPESIVRNFVNRGDYYQLFVGVSTNDSYEYTEYIEATTTDNFMFQSEEEHAPAGDDGGDITFSLMGSHIIFATGEITKNPEFWYDRRAETREFDDGHGGRMRIQGTTYRLCVFDLVKNGWIDLDITEAGFFGSFSVDTNLSPSISIQASHLTRAKFPFGYGPGGKAPEEPCEAALGELDLPAAPSHSSRNSGLLKGSYPIVSVEGAIGGVEYGGSSSLSSESGAVSVGAPVESSYPSQTPQEEMKHDGFPKAMHDDFAKTANTMIFDSDFEDLWLRATNCFRTENITKVTPVDLLDTEDFMLRRDADLMTFGATKDYADCRYDWRLSAEVFIPDDDQYFEDYGLIWFNPYQFELDNPQQGLPENSVSIGRWNRSIGYQVAHDVSGALVLVITVGLGDSSIPGGMPGRHLYFDWKYSPAGYMDSTFYFKGFDLFLKYDFEVHGSSSKKPWPVVVI